MSFHGCYEAHTGSLQQLPFKLLTLLAFTLCFASTYSADDITTEVFGSYTKFMPAAFGDFNSDKHTDFIVIEKDKKSGAECVVNVLLSHPDPPILRPVGPNCTCPGNVKSVVPGDYDGDGALDLLMLSVKSGGLYDVHVAWGNLSNLTCPTESLLTVRGQPLVMDYNGDMIADLFGESENKTRSFWLFDTSREPPRQVLMQPSPSTSLPPLRIPSSHGFVDLDGDLAADLFVTAEGQFEIWSNTDHGFTLTETIPIPDWATVVGQTTFADISLEGLIEPITVMCKTKDCSDGQVYVWSVDKKTGKKMFMSLGFPLVNKDKKKYNFPSNGHHTYPYTDTISLRVADHDLDGYPDVLFTLLDEDDNPQVFLAINEPCTESSCEHGRRLEPSWDLLAAFPGSVLATFFDVFEDGRVDVLLLHQDPTDKESFIAAAVTDTKQYDAMFLKVLVPSGRCYSECKYKSLPYGTNPAGPTFRYTIIAGGGTMQVSTATQLSQSAHMALQMPYTIFGLGRNWNFVETLSVGLSIKDTPIISYARYSNYSGSSFQKDDPRATLNDDGRAIVESIVQPDEFPTVRNSTQIVPNSQVIVIPYPLDKPSHWVYKLYITPSKALKLTAAALLVVCLLVAIVIAVLHYREKKEDRKEKLQQAQTFHFDAM